MLVVKPSEDDDKGKGILIKKSKEERKVEIEAEMKKKDIFKALSGFVRMIYLVRIREIQKRYIVTKTLKPECHTIKCMHLRRNHEGVILSKIRI